MAWLPLFLLVGAFLFFYVIAAPSEHLVSSLPGQPPVSFLQYSGYITVDAVAGRSFFYYFAAAQTNASSRPLTLWLNGGPGCSSVGNGAFEENGPFHVTKESGELIFNEFSWNRESSMLYVESPAGVGFSYSNTSSDLITNDTATALDNFVFLLNWLEAFPEYKGREFYITGESYSGHYIPQLSVLVVDYIAEYGTSVLNLVGIAISNPLLNGLVDFEETVFFHWTHGLISDETYERVISNCNFSVLANNSEACYAASAELDREVSDCIDVYDVLLDVCLPPSSLQSRRLKRATSRRKVAASSAGPLDVCMDSEVVAYLNLPSVQRALHANITGLPYRWYYCDEGIIQYDIAACDESMLPLLGYILESGVYILIFSGSEDSVVPFSGTRKQIHQLAKTMNLTTTIPYSAWFDGGQVAGWTQAYGSLTYATVRGASHLVPYSNPARALTLFQSFIGGVSLPLEPVSFAAASL